MLIDADLSDAERADAFAAVMATLLAGLCADEGERFGRIAANHGEASAMSYLSTVTRAMNEADRG